MKYIRYYKKYILILVIFLVNLSLCFNRSLWADEAWTALLMQNDFKDMMGIIANDVHPPLYFIILKIFTIFFGENIFVMKIVSLIPVIILMILGVYYINKLFNNDTVASIFILLVGLSPSCLHMTVELRMYSWSILFVTWTGFLGYSIYLNNNIKDKILFVISGLLAAYTHNFNIIAEIFVYGIFFIAMFLKNKKTIKDSIIISLVTIVGYLPWLVISFNQLRQVNEDFWLWPLNFTDVAQMIIYPFNSLCHNEIPSPLILIMIAMPLLLAILLFIMLAYKIFIIKLKKKDLVFALLCYLPMYCIIAFGIIYGLLIRPVFVARYMHSTLGLFFLAIAIAISNIDRKNIKAAAILVLICNIIYGYVFNFQREYLNGTEETLSFLENLNKDNSRIKLIVTDIYLLSTTTLNYYVPDYIIYSNADYDIYSSEEEFLYITDREEDKFDENLLDEKNIGYKKIYTSNIDNEYFFDIYLIN